MLIPIAESGFNSTKAVDGYQPGWTQQPRLRRTKVPASNHYQIITISLSNHYIIALVVSSIVSNLANKEGLNMKNLGSATVGLIFLVGVTAFAFAQAQEDQKGMMKEKGGMMEEKGAMKKEEKGMQKEKGKMETKSGTERDEGKMKEKGGMMEKKQDMMKEDQGMMK
jgi:hypothetical protein